MFEFCNLLVQIYAFWYIWHIIRSSTKNQKKSDKESDFLKKAICKKAMKILKIACQNIILTWFAKFFMFWLVCRAKRAYVRTLNSRMQGVHAIKSRNNSLHSECKETPLHAMNSHNNSLHFECKVARIRCWCNISLQTHRRINYSPRYPVYNLI